MVLLAGFVFQLANNLFALLDGQHVAQVKDGLFPVGVFCVWAGGELDGLVASGELDVKPSNDCVDEVGAAGLELVGKTEGEVGNGALVQIEGDDGSRVGDDGLEVDGVDKRLGHGGGLERGVVEAPDVVPDYCKRSALQGREAAGLDAHSQSSRPYTLRPRYRP